MGLTYSADDAPGTGSSAFGFDLQPRPAWQARGLCAQTDPDAFFPEKGGTTTDAKRICRRCDVRDECLEFAVDNDERFGVWGGLSERERRGLKRTDQAPKTTRCRYCDAEVGLNKFGPPRSYCSTKCRQAAADRRLIEHRRQGDAA